MAQSLNTKVDIASVATSYMGFASYGKVMVGDKAFEFYNDRNVEDYIQIPWEEVEYISANVMFAGKWISRFVIATKGNGNFTFSTRDNKKILKAINMYIDAKCMLRALSFFQIIKRGVVSLFSRKKA